MEIINYAECLNEYKNTCIIDVRSPLEFAQGHIPNAINFPLLNDEERKIVGTTYKQKGHELAVIKGFELVGGKFAQFLIDFKKLKTESQIIVHCWRGGLRSNIMAWLLEKGGYKPLLIKGGYKSYRNAVIQSFSKQYNFVILGGKTGSNKTKILHELSQLNNCIIDLENIANHRGSAFGGIGLGLQPTQEQFENNFYEQLQKIENNNIVWIENESRLIGRIVIPTSIYNQMRNGRLINLLVSRNIRANNIIEQYGAFDKNILEEKTIGIEKKLGNQNMRIAVDALKSNNLDAWVNILLDYYDKTYEFSQQKRLASSISSIEYDAENYIENILNAVK